jgi:hypothetical protein
VPGFSCPRLPAAVDATSRSAFRIASRKRPSRAPYSAGAGRSQFRSYQIFVNSFKAHRQTRIGDGRAFGLQPRAPSRLWNLTGLGGATQSRTMATASGISQQTVGAHLKRVLPSPISRARRSWWRCLPVRLVVVSKPTAPSRRLFGSGRKVQRISVEFEWRTRPLRGVP